MREIPALMPDDLFWMEREYLDLYQHYASIALRRGDPVQVADGVAREMIRFQAVYVEEIRAEFERRREVATLPKAVDVCLKSHGIECRCIRCTEDRL